MAEGKMAKKAVIKMLEFSGRDDLEPVLEDDEIMLVPKGEGMEGGICNLNKIPKVKELKGIIAKNKQLEDDKKKTPEELFILAFGKVKAKELVETESENGDGSWDF